MHDFTSFVRRYLGGLVVALIVVSAAVGGSYLLFRNQTPQPQNLGSQLEYIGKKDLGGCILWWCEVAPYSEFYFATDMSEEELKAYFTGAVFKESERQEYPLVADELSSNTHMHYRLTPNQEDGFTIVKYDYPEHVLKTYRLKQTDKRHIIEILDSSYERASSAL